MDNAQVVEVCPAAPWRKAPFVGSPDEHFDPSSDDFDEMEYGKEVAKKSVTNIALLAAIFAFLLFFLLWRFTRCLCVLCCCQGCCDTKRAKNANILWSKKSLVLKILLALIAIGLIGYTGYGMYNLDVNVTNDGWNVVNEAQSTIEGIFDFADEMLGELGSVVVTLDKLDNLIQEELNLTKIREDLECVGDAMTTGLPDFDALKTKLSGVDTSLKTTLPGDIDTFQTGLADLETKTLEPMKTPVESITVAQTTITRLQGDLGDYNDALNELPALYSAAADEKVAALKTAHESVGDLNPSIARLNALRDGLQSFIDDVDTVTIDDVTSHITSLTATIDSLSSDLDDVGAELRSISTSLGSMDVCFNSLMDKMMEINTTILSLPGDVGDAVASLKGVADAMNEVNKDPSLLDLADDLDALANSLTLPDTSSFTSHLAAAKSDIDSVQTQATAMISEVGTLISNLQDVSSGMDAVGSQLDVYPNPGNSGAYSSLLAATNAIKSKVQDSVQGLRDVTVDNAATFSAVADLASSIPDIEANLEEQKAAIIDFRQALSKAADLSELTASIDEMVSAFDSLPSDILNEPEAMIEQIDSLFSDAIGTVKDSIETAVEDVGTQLNDSRKDVIGGFDQLKDDYEADSEKYNHIVYVVALVLYVFSIIFALGLVIFVAIHFQFGVGLVIFLFMVVLVFYFIIATTLSVILIATNDGCYNIETIAMNNLEGDMAPLARYYLFHEGNSLKTILKDTGTVDLDTVLDQAQEARDDVVDAITNEYPPKGELDAILGEILHLTDDLEDFVARFEEKIDYSSIHPLYKMTKQYFCCKLPNVMHNIWRDLSYIGVLGLVLLFFGFIALHFLDMMPRVDLCGCSCRRRPPSGGYDKIQNPPTPVKASTSAPLIPDTPTRNQIDTTLV